MIKTSGSGIIILGDNMAGKTEYKNQWADEHCDRFSLILPKGKKKELHALANSIIDSDTGKPMHLNKWINNAIEIAEKQQKDGEKV